MLDGEQTGLRVSWANFWLESQSGLPAAVQSTSKTPALLLSLNSFMSFSHDGFILLQWPHQGAWNLMKTVFPPVSSSQLSGVRENSAEANAIEARSTRPANFIILRI